MGFIFLGGRQEACQMKKQQMMLHVDFLHYVVYRLYLQNRAVRQAL